MLENCVDIAIETYIARKDIDTNPLICHMFYQNCTETFPHWYYRSDQYINQPEDFSFFGITPFVGHPSKAPEEVYGKNKFQVDQKTINVAEKLSKLSRKK